MIKLCKPRHAFTKGKVEVLNKFLAWLLPYEGEFETEDELIDILQKINQKVWQRVCDETGVRTKLIEKLEGEGIVPVIDICNKWRDGEKTKQYRDTNLTYTFNGKVFYTNEAGKEIELMYKGYDKGSDSARYGFHPKYKDKRIFRIKLDEDRRIFCTW